MNPFATDFEDLLAKVIIFNHPNYSEIRIESNEDLNGNIKVIFHAWDEELDDYGEEVNEVEFIITPSIQLEFLYSQIPKLQK